MFYRLLKGKNLISNFLCYTFLNLQLREYNYFSPCVLFAFSFHFCAWGMNHVLFHSWKAVMGVLLISCLGCIFGRDTQLLQINKGVTEAKLV